MYLIAYDGNVEPNPSIADDCKCPSFVNNNAKAEGLYSDTHGFAFQCKHIIAARDKAKLEQAQVSMICTDSNLPEIQSSNYTYTTHETKDGTKFYESKMIQTDRLL